MAEKYKTYPESLVRWGLCGPNALMLTEELTDRMNLSANMNVLDLGCGKALSSMFIAKEYDAKVFSVDPEIPVDAVIDALRQLKLEKKVFPFHMEAGKMPFPANFFDGVICVNAYQFVASDDEDILTSRILPVMKKGASIGFVLPAYHSEKGKTEEASIEGLIDQGIAQFTSVECWKEYFSDKLKIKDSWILDCTEEANKSMFLSGNPFFDDSQDYEAKIRSDIVFLGIIAEMQ